MEDVWAPVVAGVAASFLTVIGTFALARWQSRRREKNLLASERRSAYSGLIALTGAMVHSGWMLRLTIEMRSGLGEGIDVALRLRQPIDPFALDEWMRKDLDRLYVAWADIWTIGSVEAVEIGNRIVDRVADIISEASARGEGRGRVGARVIGEKWSRDQIERWFSMVEELGNDRRSLAAIARLETGLEVADTLQFGST